MPTPMGGPEQATESLQRPAVQQPFMNPALANAVMLGKTFSKLAPPGQKMNSTQRIRMQQEMRRNSASGGGGGGTSAYLPSGSRPRTY